MKLNIGSGENKVEGFVNIDMEEGCRPDLLLDIRKERFPYSDNSVEEAWMTHALEHIERRYWDQLFMEVKRVLIINGKFVLAYPEFSKCATNFLNNKNNNRTFWAATLFGLQRWPGDYHVTPMDSSELATILESYGFYRIQWVPESGEEFNSVMVAFSDPTPMSRELLLAKELGLNTKEAATL
jgi:predicted SAM-dependent methyltransferase